MESTTTEQPASKTLVIVALLSLYVFWSLTYLAIRIALEGFPPFLMAGSRFLLVGLGLYVYLRIKGAPAPQLPEWRSGLLVGGLLLLGGNGGVVVAEQWVASGVAALGVATTPLWTVLFTGIWKRWPTRIEWAGLGLGLIGVILLNLGGDLRASPAGSIALIIATLSWSFGSAWSRQLPLPKGMMASAVQMIGGSLLLLVASLIMDEHMVAVPTWRAIWAMIYLAIFGSLVGYCAYNYLLNKVRPALATSYAYVNPAAAVLLGAWLLDERICTTEIAAMLVILTGIVLVVLGQRR